MMCYKDMTFCTFWEYCLDSELCGRALTEEKHNDAKEWWGSDNPPICTFSEKPSCFEESA